MGIQSLQDFVDSFGKYSIPLPTYLETTARKTSNLLILNADSCLRYFYHDNIDWVCGGQWSELFQCVEKFVRAFRQADIELIVFFDGSVNKKSLLQWTSKHENIRVLVKDIVSHVTHSKSIPFRSKGRDFVPPGSLRIALRLAFRACNAMVCSSLEDICKETALYCKDENCIGIIGSNSNYFFYKIPSYISMGQSKWLKKIVSSCKVNNFKALMTDFDLRPIDLPYFAALIGSFELPDRYLASLYWNLLDDDNPLKKVKENLPADAVLPPSDLRIKCVLKFITEKREEIRDLKWLANFIFKDNAKISVEEGEKRLKDLIEYYEEILKISRASKVEANGKEWSISGYPSLSDSKDFPNHHRGFKRDWSYCDKVKTSRAAQKKKTTEKETPAPPTIEDPEKVLKEGTLEEAAQALEQLELKESEAEATKGSTQNEQKETESEVESKPTVAEEKPSIEEVDEEKEQTKIIIQIFDEIDSEDENNVDYPREISITPVLPTIHENVMDIARKRHQSGQMCQEVLNLLTKGELVIHMTIDDEEPKNRLPIPLIYRPLRQLIYSVLFGNGKVEEKEPTPPPKEEESPETEHAEGEEKEEPKVNGNADHSSDSEEEEDQKAIKTDVPEEDLGFVIKEWCVHSDKDLETPDLVKPKCLSWGVPPLKRLWFGTDSEDNANRLKAFLSCMKSDTVNMSNTAMVPQRLMLLCCVLRYLIQQDSKVSVLTKQDIDAFLAQALSAQLTTEHNTQNLANLKLNQIDPRCVQLASIFMSGIENAIIANDACGSPVPWEFCCPWNFFDGKLFHSKWLQSTMNFSTADLCEGKPQIAEKLERLRWCITEGLESKYPITGLEHTKKFFSPFGTPVSMHSMPFNGVMRPPGAAGLRGRSRGSTGKHLVHGSGGTLHVAGVPVAHWGGNKAGVGYSKNAPTVLVGGPNSVDLPSDHKRGRGRRGRGGSIYTPNTGGRGLLETPYISPWQQGFGYEEMQNANFKRYMKGVQKIDQVRSNISKMSHPQYQRPPYNTRQRYQQQHQQTQQQSSKFSSGQQPLQHNSYYSQPPHPTKQITKQPESYSKNMWLGKGRGQQTPQSNNYMSQLSQGYRPHQQQQHSYGRGQWLNNNE